MSMENKVKLVSSDKEEFEVDLSVVEASELLMNVVEDVGKENPVFMTNVSSAILKKVIDYCTYHVESNLGASEKSTAAEDEIKHWDSEFVKVDHATLVGLINAANYLNMKNFMDFMCGTFADMIKGKTAEEIRRTFGIMNDFTPKEEEKIRRENDWIFH